MKNYWVIMMLLFVFVLSCQSVKEEKATDISAGEPLPSNTNPDRVPQDRQEDPVAADPGPDTDRKKESRLAIITPSSPSSSDAESQHVTQDHYIDAFDAEGEDAVSYVEKQFQFVWKSGVDARGPFVNSYRDRSNNDVFVFYFQDGTSYRASRYFMTKLSDCFTGGIGIKGAIDNLTFQLRRVSSGRACELTVRKVEGGNPSVFLTEAQADSVKTLMTEHMPSETLAFRKKQFRFLWTDSKVLTQNLFANVSTNSFGHKVFSFHFQDGISGGGMSTSKFVDLLSRCFTGADGAKDHMRNLYFRKVSKRAGKTKCALTLYNNQTPMSSFYLTRRKAERVKASVIALRNRHR
ncbi:MAG: hypothetical protein OXC44_01810 [Proteobacteria bacterium]|nr:hypothetical protein [Pseudomonadota bacterium]